MPIIIGIAGGSASGKSTFTDILANRLSDIRTAVFHMDSYFKSHDELPRSVSPVSGKVYADYNLPESFELQRLRDDLANVIDADAVIVEGLFTLWDDMLCRLLDLKLFVDCRADERIVRRLRRNMTYGCPSTKSPRYTLTWYGSGMTNSWSRPDRAPISSLTDRLTSTVLPES